MTVTPPPYGEAIEHTFGHDFSYAAWSPNSALSLHNVPWDAAYRDIVNYGSQGALDAYLNTVKGPEYTTGASYLKPFEPVTIGLPFNKCFKYNYLRVTNPAQPLGNNVDEPRTFYYFITGVQYMSPQATRLTLQLDVWQTFSRFVKFGRCYIERGHIGIANENQFADHGREYLTVPEGLDVGNEYVISDHMEHVIAKGDTWDFTVMVTTTVTWQNDPGTVDEPKLRTAQGTSWERVPNGCEIYLMEVGQFMQFMLYATEVPWVTQGIISITAVPNIYAEMQGSPNVTEMTLSWAGNAKALYVLGGEALAEVVKIADNWRDRIDIPARYSNLEKFKTYPYALLEMTSYTGNPVILKPECLAMDGLHVGMGTHLVPPDARIAFYPFKYNGKMYSSDAAALADKSSDTLPNDYAEFLDVTTGIFNLPQFSLVNDMYYSYMAGNRQQIGYQYNAADWSQVRTMQTASNTADNTAGNIKTGVQSMEVERAGLLGQAGITAVQQGANGFAAGAQGLASQGKNFSQGAQAGAGAGNLPVVDMGATMARAGIQANTMTTVAGLQAGNATEINERNYNLAKGIAAKDNQMDIASINARVQDAKMLQPSTSGQMGGEAFNLIMFKWGVFFKVKTLQAASRNAIGEYWLRFGYAINRFGVMPSSFTVMSKFTYWKLKQTYLTSGACPELYKQAIRGIFEQGVTVWTSPGDIGNIDIADNQPLEGVTL